MMISKCLSLNLILFFGAQTMHTSQSPVKPYVPTFKSTGPFTRVNQDGSTTTYDTYQKAVHATMLEYNQKKGEHALYKAQIS